MYNNNKPPKNKKYQKYVSKPFKKKLRPITDKKGFAKQVLSNKIESSNTLLLQKSK